MYVKQSVVKEWRTCLIGHAYYSAEQIAETLIKFGCIDMLVTKRQSTLLLSP